MRAHIINCSSEVFEEFVSNGYIGVGIVTPVDQTRRSKMSALQTSYSMIADMKSIREGDFVFIHSDQKIYGVFEAATEFLEQPDIPDHYKSDNLKIEEWERASSFPDFPFCRQIAIKPHGNLCFVNGFDSTEVFKLKGEGKIWTIPDRWRYTDTNRAVRPLTMQEAKCLIEILMRENSDSEDRRAFNPKALSSFNKIFLVLEPLSGHRELRGEKILESWILDNATERQGNALEHRNVVDSIGKMTYYGNNIPAFYLNFIDIFSYYQQDDKVSKFRVIELKKGNLTDASYESEKNELRQLIDYLDWVVKTKAGGDTKKVEGILVARRFSDKYKNYVRERDKIESGNRIKLIEYALFRRGNRDCLRLNLLD